MVQAVTADDLSFLIKENRTMKWIALLIVGTLCCELNHVFANIDPADSRITYSGRWDFSARSKPWCAWQGSSIKAKFHGTDIQAVFELTGRPEYVRIIIDGNADSSRKIELFTKQQTYALASGLSAGEHQIEIVKETYSGKGRMIFHGFHVSGKGLLDSASTQQPLRIVFFGDSNLAGSSLEHEKNEGSPSLRGCYYSLAGIASRMLDAEYHNISCGGAKIAGGLNSGMSFYNRVDFYQPEPRWKPETFPADICVVNLGANDISSKSKDQIKQDYVTFVATIRSEYPSARIVLMNGYGWSRKEPANYTQEVIAAMGDTKLSRVIFPWLFNEWHGCEYDHAGMAQSLVDHLVLLDPILCKQVRPLDVMDGFGRDGNVANGSFERMAPFGGYGWRYFTDGAQRIHNAGASADGEWFLRLPPGKQVHQPNPASVGNTYTIKLKMRGREAGDEGLVRIEFRDQEWRHEIPGSSRTFRYKLDATWNDYGMTLNSPAASQPQDASRDPRQIIIRLMAESGTVDIDDVQLSHVARTVSGN
jgi:hypothetical protein